MVDMVTTPWVEQEGRLAESCEECFNCWLGGVFKSALCGERVELKVWSPVVLNLMVPTVFPLLNLLPEPVLLGLWWLLVSSQLLVVLVDSGQLSHFPL